MDRVAKLVLERRRVQQRCPRAPTPEPGKRAPTQEPAISKAKSVSALVSCLLPVLARLCRGFPGSGSPPSGSCLFWFRLVFLSTGRGRHVPAPSGRDVGSNSGAPTQEPVQGADPRTGFYGYSLTYVGFAVLSPQTRYSTSSRLSWSFPSCRTLLYGVPGHNRGEWRRRHSPQGHKGGPAVMLGTGVSGRRVSL